MACITRLRLQFPRDQNQCTLLTLQSFNILHNLLQLLPQFSESRSPSICTLARIHFPKRLYGNAGEQQRQWLDVQAAAHLNPEHGSQSARSTSFSHCPKPSPRNCGQL
jgi:hypothetical protein